MSDLTGLEARLRADGLSVESLSEGDPLEVTYMTAFPGGRLNNREAGRACVALLNAAEEGEWEPTRVEATAVRSPGDVLGTWHAEPEWFEALLADEITETAFSARVVETVSETEG